MYALFFDCQGIVANVPVPGGGSDKGVLYRDLIISAVVEHFITACPHMAMCGIKLLHDSRGPQPPNIPDLVQCFVCLI